MTKKLVIVESPSKAKTIYKILGKDYVVLSSVGHIRDLPHSTIGVDIEDSFKPEYVIIKGKQKVVTELKKAVKECDTVFLAPDPDREGEAIAWHLKEVLEDENEPKKFLRVTYNEVTPRAVRQAFENPGEIDYNRVNSQQARRVLDRIVGYTVSPMLWRRIKPGLSAGRVQSVALRLVCEREEVIKNFKSEEYWLLGAEVRKLVEPLDPFKIKLMRINKEKPVISNKEEADRIKADLEGKPLRVAGITIKEVSRRPAPPHITSTLQQAGSSYCGFSPKQTMSIAQKLYEGIDFGEGHVGLITYMRTDSFAIAQDALNECRDLIGDKFGKEYLPEKANFYKSRHSAQEAHEAIRPTDVKRTPESLASKLDPAAVKIYKLIWNRFVASQMTPAKIGHRTVKIEDLSKDGKAGIYIFQATASEVKFPGYMKVSGIDIKKKKEDEEEDEQIPELSEGEKLHCLKWLSEQKETKPPGRYHDSSLIKMLEKNGVGRPSTYAHIISTLRERDYVKRGEKALIPTQVGMDVNRLLVETLGMLFNVEFTAGMEGSLDEIEGGKVEWTKMMEDFYMQFEDWMKNTVLPPADPRIVRKMLGLLESVKEWAPEVKTGVNKVYSDEKFVESIKKQLEKGRKDISVKQLEALIKVACHYKSQLPEAEQAIKESGYERLLSSPDVQPPKKSTLQKFELLKEIKLAEATGGFVDSLKSRADSGRCLSEAQIRALNNIVVAHADKIEDFEKIRGELDVEGSDVAEDNQSGPLIKSLEDVKEWKDPVKRGRRTFDDKAFYSSLFEQYCSKGFLSVKQRASLKKMVARYQDQIPGYKKLAEKFELKVKEKNS